MDSNKTARQIKIIAPGASESYKLENHYFWNSNNCFLADGMKMRNVKNTPEVMINGDTKRKHKPVSYREGITLV